jgi:hypothetical protein
MSHLTIALLLVGALVVMFGTVMAVRMYLKNRVEEIAPFRHYFGPEYDRDLLRQSSWCDDQNLCDRQTGFNAFSVRNPGTDERYSRDSSTTRRDGDRD